MSPKTEHDPMGLGNFFEGDKVLNERAFRCLIENDSPIKVDVLTGPPPVSMRHEYTIAYRSVLYDENDKAIWRSGVRKTSQEALNHAKGMVDLYRWLIQRALSGKADPEIQLAEGVSERLLEKKA